MEKILAYPLTVLYLIFFGITLSVFHPVQWICLNVFGYNAHRKSVSILNLCLMRCTHLLGTRYSFQNEFKIPVDKAVIIVANHQSMNDIPPIIWYLRRHHPKFISKKELGKGIPSVSYNLRHGGSVLIDRKDAIRSLKAIKEFAERVSLNKWGAVIFPEGTRSRDGKVKPFKRKGLETLIMNMPGAVVLPISIENSWKTLKFGKFPMGLGAHIRLKVHKPLEADPGDVTNQVNTVEKIINEQLSNT